ncbi:MAG: ATP phosphoribosyltransferase regulatory subunit [Chloroflexi bacterium]|nr:ATP phosphoribosyltransferase regulatory subunit [Chloroflexota bacterium]
MQGQIPFGVADYFWEEALQRQELIADLLATFRAWGYGDVMPPAFEYAASLSAQASAGLQAEMYRFLDRDGSTLALRPEFTTPVARLVGTRLHDWPMPQRFCYGGSVFRYVDPQAGRQREFWQAGVELFGAPSPDADAEVLALTAEAMAVTGLADYRIVLGQMRYFGGLLAALDLTPPQTEALHWAIERKSEPALADFLRETPLRTGQRQAVEALPGLSGDPSTGSGHRDIQRVIDQAERHCLNTEMHRALVNLREIVDALAGYGVLGYVVLDLTEIRSLGYYTGISFEALAPQSGFSIGSGGRYDDLVAHFGPAQPAVGVALGVDRLLLARQRQAGATVTPQPVRPHALVITNRNPAAIAQVQGWRTEGYRLQVEVNGRGLSDVLAHAVQIGVGQVLAWEEGRFVAYRANADGLFAPSQGEISFDE